MPSRRGRKGATAGGSGEAIRRLQTGGRELIRLLVGAVQEIVKAVVAIGELLGRLELRAGRFVSGPALVLARGARAAIRAAERAVTPQRAVGAVILAAAITLGVSQFVDYRGVGIGTPLYEGVEGVTPPPQTDKEPTGAAHSYVMLPIAVLAIGALAFALRGRWQLGRAIALLGAAVIAVTLLVDMPKGLDEGQAARDFEGTEALLLEGFWVQLSSAAVLVVTGLLLSRYVRLGHGTARGRSGRSRAAGARRGSSSARGRESVGLSGG